jgi:hypothetical protein
MACTQPSPTAVSANFGAARLLGRFGASQGGEVNRRQERAVGDLPEAESLYEQTAGDDDTGMYHRELT